MTTTFTTTKKVLTGFVAAVLFIACGAQFAEANTYYTTTPYYQTVPVYQSSYYTKPADIQALLNQVHALLAQLQALQGYGYTYQYAPTKKVVTYTDTIYGRGSYDVEVTTKDADVDGDEATLEGDIDLDDAPYATVWFVYGTSGSLNEESDDKRVDDDGSFEIEIDDLDDDERYFYRAVAQDPSGFITYGNIKAFDSDDRDRDDDDDDNDDDRPEATTEDADDIDEDSAEIRGEIDMNDFDDGKAFFVYGEDEDLIEDVEDENSYDDIDEEGDDLQKILLSSSFDGSRTFFATIFSLDEDTEYFYRICVEYEDEDDDETLECGDVESFTTDED